MSNKVDPAKIDNLVTSYIVTKLVTKVMDNLSSFNKGLDSSEQTQIAYSEFNEYIEQRGNL